MKLPFIIIVLFLSQWLHAFTISGTIYDINNNPIDNASIVISENSSLNTVSNSNGNFFIDKIDIESSVIKIYHIGFKPYIKEINFKQVGVLDIFLEPNIIDLDRIVVTGTKSERHIKETPMLTHIIGKDEILSSSYSNVKDILEMAMPNVQNVTSNHGNDRVKIQGLDNKYLTFLVDGDRVSGEFAGNIDFSMLGLFNVDKIEVIEGAMSTLYGSGAIGGVVNIITKINEEPYWINAGIQYDDPIGVTPFINIGFNKNIFNYSLNIQSTHSDGYDLSPDLEGVYNMTLDENKSQILNHRLIISPSDKHNFKLIYKDYSSRINKYSYFAGNLVIDAPLNKYNDEYYKLNYKYKISDNQFFKISYLTEDYTKYYYYPYYYSDGQYIFNPDEFINAMLSREEINLEYNIEDLRYKRLIGIESYDENYSSFNIYYPNGDMLQESIFEGQDLMKNDNNISLYFYEERKLNNSTLSCGLRILSKDNITLPSFSYLVNGSNNYNYRFSYSQGYRSPSIKERYYQWQDHAGPDIYGNPDLWPTKNNYFSISLDKRSTINDFSVDVYRNDIDDMISTEYDSEGNLIYKNYDKVLIHGLNVHYYRKISDKLKLRFVYNLTDASSNSNEILEGISKHSFRLSSYYQLSTKLDLVTNIKYAGKKFIFDQEQDFVGNPSVRDLSSYFISDLYLNALFKSINFKIGIKNLFNYMDPDRLSSSILNNYDPGRRLFVELSINFNGGYSDDE